MKLHCFPALLLLVLLSPALANGQLPYTGVVITKQGQYDKDIHAAATPFTGMQTSGPFTSFGLTTGGRLNIPNGQIVQIVSFGDAQLRNLSTPAEAEHLKALSDFFTKVAGQYPKSQPYLQQMQAVIAADLQRYSGGEVRVGNVWTTPERATAMIKEREARELTAREAAEKRMAAERALAAAAEREADRKRSNLATSWKSSGAAFLVSMLKAGLDESNQFEPRVGSVVSSLPVSKYLERGVELPDYSGCTTVLHDGQDPMSMACMALSRDGVWKRVVAALPMPVKNGKCQNPEQAAAFSDFISDIDPEVGLWLPSALASARTRLQSFGKSAPENNVWVLREFASRDCSLTLTRPDLMPGGIDYYYVILFID